MDLREPSHFSMKNADILKENVFVTTLFVQGGFAMSYFLQGDLTFVTLSSIL